MSNTPNYVQIPPNSSGLKIDTSEVTSASGNTVERQNIVIADPATGTSVAGMGAFADITSKDSLGTGALLVDASGTISMPQMADVIDLLQKILTEIREQTRVLGGFPLT